VYFCALKKFLFGASIAFLETPNKADGPGTRFCAKFFAAPDRLRFEAAERSAACAAVRFAASAVLHLPVKIANFPREKY
jgi:hypothetical protein